MPLGLPVAFGAAFGVAFGAAFGAASFVGDVAVSSLVTVCDMGVGAVFSLVTDGESAGVAGFDFGASSGSGAASDFCAGAGFFWGAGVGADLADGAGSGFGSALGAAWLAAGAGAVAD